MTDALSARAARDQPARFRIRETRDRRALDAAFSEDRAYACYALGQLEQVPFERAHYWMAEGPDGIAIVLHGEGMGVNTYVGGNAAGVDAILALHPGPRSSYITTSSPAHRAALERTYHLSEVLPMRRMSVTRASFAAMSLPDGSAARGTRRLRGEDIRALNGLYALDGEPSTYTADHITLGVYYGAYIGEQLVAAAGTHIISPSVGVGVVGNVFTHPAHRGQGLATAVTSRVTAELLDRGCALVALTVDPDNTPALHAYTRLGYEPGAPVVEARARRRDHLGLRVAVRRYGARRRSDESVEEYTPSYVLTSDG